MITEISLSRFATFAEKVSTVVSYLTEGHIDTFGGYPYGWAQVGNCVFVAALDDGKDRHATVAQVHHVDELAAWYDRALAYAAVEKCDAAEALGETENE